ncbi:RsmE family RNA methyltransferase [Fenollaria sporofastidiosus]|uniref:RsmE family RNA methyltransferase n=1 Tax=Fenollaria sporofastidiosus TaxID=2811778 RepID=UPI001C0049F3|nr:RsmE family RNA methyltransferase [Fenollaria sporofastidiosus]
MHRFFAQRKAGDLLYLVKEDIKHFKDVLRIKDDEEVEVYIDGSGYIAILNSYAKDELSLKIISEIKEQYEPNIKITLFQSLVKSDKMDFIIQKAIEMGVYSIVPIETKRSIVKKKDIKDKKLERYKNIAKAAAMQSKREFIPSVADAIKFDEAKEILDSFDLVLIAYEDEIEHSIKDFEIKDKKNIAIIVGPEGGFDISEVDELKRCGYKSISMGKRILRAETAPIALLTMLYYEYNGSGLL